MCSMPVSRYNANALGSLHHIGVTLRALAQVSMNPLRVAKLLNRGSLFSMIRSWTRPLAAEHGITRINDSYMPLFIVPFLCA